ncbi:MAG: Asp-tRNA(Asn)/Glu-tRNA(Gln) amidotransferase subunit GatB [Spirochaetes bacterium]|jgi:aspartyl-tRNA(Asn)/glutamyl-tRNA(Gln) amidotransferase subunit B|nr:Asp-tRNA(Asn)/Glu-tRNA(Gln) amidotransferase subunit GatB [Spirochaetota bacterium]
MEYEPVIGLEVHVQLNTESKIFCGCSTKFGSDSNTQTCPVCLGLPGVLPVLNEEVLKKGILAGLAINAKIASYSKFDRKNYFYPDLPKAYQISQYDKPICEDGYIEIPVKNGLKKIGIKRLHLEEDAGKSIHSETPGNNFSFVDLNRTGVPLAEIVSEPELGSGDEAYEYLQKIKTIMKYIDVSDVNMEEGSLRCDVNVSVREKGAVKFGEKVEIKNLNSFKSVRASINYEIERQIRMIESGEKIVQETRLWDADSNETYSMRSKEDAHDYRYFPDPDLAPIILAPEYIEEIKKTLPELPDAKLRRFVDEYSLPEYDSSVLTSVKQLADYFEETVKLGANPKKASNWIMSELLARITNPEEIKSFHASPGMLAKLLALIEDGTISGKIAKTVFEEMTATGKGPEQIIDEKGLKQVSDTGEIDSMIDAVLKNNQKSVDDFKNGKENAFKFLVGQVMKESKGKANPILVNDLLLKKISG